MKKTIERINVLALGFVTLGLAIETLTHFGANNVKNFGLLIMLVVGATAVVKGYAGVLRQREEGIYKFSQTFSVMATASGVLVLLIASSI